MIILHPENGCNADFDWRYLDTSNNLTCPWYTFGALEMLNEMDLKSLSVFEYGCGISSKWWKHKTSNWRGVDFSKKWADLCSCEYIPTKEQYISACVGEIYDVIVIDGEYRDDCTEHALKSIAIDGYLIIDNWDQPTVDMPETYWSKSKQLLSKYENWVFKEPAHQDWKTAIFKIT